MKDKLPKNYQNLPGKPLKDGVLSFSKKAKEQIDFVLQNSEAEINMGRDTDQNDIFVNAFSRHIIEFLNNPEKNVKEKIERLEKELYKGQWFDWYGDRCILFYQVCKDPSRGRDLKRNEQDLELFLKAGVNINQIIKTRLFPPMRILPKKKNRYTPLMVASFQANQYLGIVKFLLDHGADLTVEDRYGNTALDYAVIKDPCIDSCK